MSAHRLCALGLAVLATFVVLFAQRDVGIARDEVVYMQSGARYATWWIELAQGKHGISERSVTSAFGGPGATDNNREHPPLMKTLFGLSARALHRGLGVDEVAAYRAPSAVMHGALVWIAVSFAFELWGLAHAIVAGLLLIALPRAVFHAGLACFDAPTMTLWFATVVAYWRALDGRRWPWQVGVAWGLALATKHTALLLPFALGLHYLIVGWQASAGRVGARLRATLAYRWRVLVSLAVLGPLTLYAVWPWLWFAPLAHARDWLAFHLHHVHYNYEYLGQNWNAPRFPWHVALVTTLFTVPVATLAAALVGAAAWIGARRKLLNAPGLLLGVSLAASMGPFFLGTTPIFGAEKHWMPALPSICLVAAAGVVWAAKRAAVLGERWTIAALATVVVGAAAVELVVASPYALTWYNALAGGAPGGADLGMNRQFWGVAARGVLPVLPAAAATADASIPVPSGSGGGKPSTTYVYTHDASPAWSLYQREGLVPASFADAGWEQAGIERSQLAFVVHERHFNRHDYLIWAAYGSVRPVFVLTSDGVPIVSLYARSRR